MRYWIIMTWCATVGISVGAMRAQTVGPIVSTNLFEPYGVTVDAANNYYIADSANNRVAKVDPNTGQLLNFAGSSGPTTGGALDGKGRLARFRSPQGLVIQGDSLLVADTRNHLIRRIGIEGDVTTIAGDIAHPEPGWVDGIGSDARFNSPVGLALSVSGTELYIADSLNNAIRKLDLSTGSVTTLVDSGLFKPIGLAVDASGTLYISNTGFHSIMKFSEESGLALLAGGNARIATGLKDAALGADALFDTPRGLVYLQRRNELLIADSGNQVLRRISLSDSLAGVSVLSNTVDARLGSPVGLAVDNNSNILITDLDRHQLFAIRATEVVQNPVAEPKIGTVTLVEAGFARVTRLDQVINSTFNNDVIVAILAEQGTQTYYTLGPTDNIESIPDPTANDSNPPQYMDGEFDLPRTLISPVIPDLTIKAISTQVDRIPSDIVTARFRFQVANPEVLPRNPASFEVQSATENAQLYYTFGPTLEETPEPTTQSTHYVVGTRINIAQVNQDVVFKVRGYKAGYFPSTVVTHRFLAGDAEFSSIGIPDDLVGGVGSSLQVPVEVRVPDDQALRSLQFKVQISPETDRAGIETPSLTVQSIRPNQLIPINFPGTNVANVIPFQIGDIRGVGIAYLGSNSTFRLTGSSTVALLSVEVPRTSKEGDRYRLSVSTPSATSDGQQASVELINFGDRFLTISNLTYLVGDTAVATWFNAGDFGDGILNNADVNHAFLTSLGVREVHPFSDLYNAMDAFPLDDFAGVGGDGQVRFLDWQVILRRALGLDTSLWERRWSVDGNRERLLLDDAGSLAAALPGEETTLGEVWDRDVRVGAGWKNEAVPGQVVEVPLYVQISPGEQLSGFQFRLKVTPGEGSAPLSQPVAFLQKLGLRAPREVEGLGMDEIAGAWSLGELNPIWAGREDFGVLRIPIPPQAKSGDSYRIDFFNTDGAPDLDRQFEFETLPGFVGVGIQSGLREGQAVSPEWVAHFFPERVGSGFSDEEEDSDGDRMKNWEEYRAGTDPRNASSNLNVQMRPLDGGAGWMLSWKGVKNKKYRIERTTSIKNGSWSLVQGGLGGESGLIEQSVPNSGGVDSSLILYRVRLEE